MTTTTKSRGPARAAKPGRRTRPAVRPATAAPPGRVSSKVGTGPPDRTEAPPTALEELRAALHLRGPVPEETVIREAAARLRQAAS